MERVRFECLETRTEASMPDGTIKDYNLNFQLRSEDKYSVLLFYPKDFTFVCPTELQGFSDLTERFTELGAQVFGISQDTAEVHNAWRIADKRIGAVKFPLLADHRHLLSHFFNVYNEKLGVPERGLFVIKDSHIIFKLVSSIDVGRDPQVVIDFIEAHKTGKRTPCMWKPGEDFV